MAASNLWNSIRGGALRSEHRIGEPESLVSRVDHPSSVSSPNGSDSGGLQGTDWTDSPGERTVGPGLRALVRDADIAFGYGASKIEEYAQKEAREQGDKSLPSIDIHAEKELEAETVIRERSKKVFSDWLRSLRDRVADATLAACNAAGEKMELLKNAIHEFEQTLTRIAQLEAPSQPPNGTEESSPHTRYERLMNHWFYLVVIGMLILVDWVANVPVFRELLPQDAGAEDFWRHILQESERFGSLAGIYRVWERVIFSPDVSFLALGVIVILVFSGHVCGSSLRRLIALRSETDPSVTDELHPYRQQTWIPFVLSCVAISFCLSFLFISRSELQASATARFDAASGEVQMYTKQLNEAKADDDDDGRVDSQVKLGEAKKRLDQRTKDFDYATRISIMNFPILLLNTALVLCASVGAYLVSSGDVSQRADSEPNSPGRRKELARFHEEARIHREKVRRQVASVQASLTEAEFLSKAKPFRGWEAKAARLESMIPLFRSTNATHRGVNVQQVRGFGPLVKLELPPVDEEETIQPEGLNDRYHALEAELSDIRKHIESIHLVSMNGRATASLNGATEVNQSGIAVTSPKGGTA